MLVSSENSADHLGKGFHLRPSDVGKAVELGGEVLGRDDVIVPNLQVADPHLGEGQAGRGTDTAGTDERDRETARIKNLAVPGMIHD